MNSVTGRLPMLVSAALSLTCSRPPAPEFRATDLAAAPRGAAPLLRNLDDFESIAPWRLETSDAVSGRIQSTPGVEGGALRLDFDFGGHGGHASMRRALPLELPTNYELSFDLVGDAAPNDLQLKLVDASGENVWWFRQPNLEFPKRWQRITVKKRQIEFAWGPVRAAELQRSARIELVVAAGSGGGRGWFAVDRLQLRELPPVPATPPAPVASASSSREGALPALALDRKRETAWRSAAAPSEQFFSLDFGYSREFGGLVLRWKDGARPSHYDVELSDDAQRWRTVRSVTGADGERDAIRLPESEARYLRLKLRGGPPDGYALAELEVRELAFGATQNAFVSALAHESARGSYPRSFIGEQTYWTLVGVDGGRDSALISEDGAIELGKGGVSIEPFVLTAAGLASWADVRIEHTLRDGYLPLPGVSLLHPDWRLRISPFATGAAERPELALHYELENLTKKPLALTLVLALRPFQVNPPTQSLNLLGGVSPIERLAWDGSALSVNGRPALFPLSAPDHVALTRFDTGGFPQYPLTRGRAVPELEDPTGLASATLAYELRLAAGERRALGLVAPLHREQAAGATSSLRNLAALEREGERVAARWREKLNRVALTVPKEGQALADTLRTSLAHILISRDGPVLRPGTRSYARSWIRDGAMMSEALLRLGHQQAASEYLAFYAPYQFPNGKIPCCVDARGADPVPENDSAGQFIFLAAESYRFGKNREELTRLWPAVESAARYLESLRQSERTAKNTTPERRAYYGLMPPSISHEGYSDRPAYAYWDDFWALLGFEDAAELAEVLGQRAAAQRLSHSRDEFRAELYASLRESVASRGLSFIPGAADRGDFDPTSTTIALSPGREGPHLPKELLLSTFERYFREFQARAGGSATGEVYTPYELRVVGSFVRLGWRERAQELLTFFMKDRRPAPWNQWAEVVGRSPRAPRFIGDMPHAWIASDYIRSVLDLFAYARAADQSLVIAAGVPVEWWTHAGAGVRGLRSPYGSHDYSIARQGGRVVVRVSGSAPPGGVALPWPWPGAPGKATVNGQPASWRERELHLHTLPARIVLEIPTPNAERAGSAEPSGAP